MDSFRWNVIGIDPKVSKEVKSAYDTIENVEDGKIAIISCYGEPERWLKPPSD